MAQLVKALAGNLVNEFNIEIDILEEENQHPQVVL